VNEIKHISKEEFYSFKHNLMNLQETEAFLEHISSCDFCSDQFAAMMSEDVMVAPRNLKENILQATKRPEVQLAIMARETSRKMQLFLYSLKVGTATAAALALLILSMNFANNPATSSLSVDSNKQSSTMNIEKVSLTAVIRDNMNTLSNSILDFSNTIMNTEVTNND